MSSALHEAATESVSAGTGSLADAATTIDLWIDPLETASAKPQHPLQFVGQPAEPPPARPRRRRLWISALATLVLTVALARLCLGSHEVEDEEQLIEDQLAQLQDLSAHAETLSAVLKDESTAKYIQDFRLRMAALHAEVAERRDDGAEQRGLARGRWSAGKEALMRKKQLEKVQKVSAEMTQSLQRLTWTRLHAKVHGVSAVSRHLAQHAASLRAISDRFKTQEAQVTYELVANISRGVKQDVQTLNTMLREGEKVLTFPLLTSGESARLLEVSVAYAEKIESISLKASDALSRVEEWHASLKTVVAVGALIEGVEIARQIDRLLLDVSTLSARGEGSDVVRGFTRAQKLVNALLSEVHEERCPLRIADHLFRLKEIGQEAKIRYEEWQRLAGHDERHSLVCPLFTLEYYDRVANQEANAAELHGALVNTLVTKLSAFAKQGGEGKTAWHSELTTSLGKVVVVSRQIGDIADDARENAQGTAASTSIADAEVRANLTKLLRAGVYKGALEAVRTAATCSAWAQLDSAVQQAVVSINGSLSLLQELPKKPDSKASSVAQLLQDADPKLAIRRYRASTTLRQGKRQVLALLEVARRLEIMQMAQEMRTLGARKEEGGRRPLQK
ncbi:hypothetical protein ACSSS7_004463 [Eimeria intestinalis]